MKKIISVFTVICIMFTTIFCTGSSFVVFGADNDMDFEDALPIESNTIYEVSVENGDYLICSFTAPEDGYYLFEALGEKYKVGAFFEKEYEFYEPVCTIYDSDKNEVQYVESDNYDSSIDGQAPYAKMVQKLKKGEVCYYKTNLLNPEHSGTYILRVMKAPDLVFTFLAEDQYIGYYELYRYTGSSKKFTLNNRYTVSEDDSLYTPMSNVIFDRVGLWAFEGNEYLEEITFPYDFEYIASEAFLNCKNLNTVNLSRNINRVGYRAFAGCDSLKSITIKSHHVFLEPECLGFDEDGNKYDDFTIICNKDSTAEEYAKEYGINYTLIGSEPTPSERSSNSSYSTDPSKSSTTESPKPTAATTYQNPSSGITSITPSNSIQVIKPKVKKATIKKVKKTSKKKQLNVTWKKISNISGYQIKCGLNKKMTKGKKVVLAKASKKSKIIKGLKSKRIYYIKIRAYKTYISANGELLIAYGKWSNVKRARTR